MDDGNKICMPTQAEKEQAITFILNTGLPEAWNPERSVRQALRELPPSVWFFGVGDCVFLAVIVSILCLVPVVAVAEEGPLVPLLFLISPLLYALLQVLTMWKDAMSGTLEWKQTCRISFRLLTAVRMLLFGGASVGVCVPANVLLWSASGHRLELPWMLCLSFSGLFVYAALSLTFQRVGRRWWFAAPLLWISAGILMLCWSRAAEWLMDVPAFLFVLVSVGALVVCFRQWKHQIVDPFEGGICYAVR